jgi:hypothetical protein
MKFIETKDGKTQFHLTEAQLLIDLTHFRYFKCYGSNSLLYDKITGHVRSFSDCWAG